MSTVNIGNRSRPIPGNGRSGYIDDRKGSSVFDWARQIFSHKKEPETTIESIYDDYKQSWEKQFHNHCIEHQYCPLCADKLNDHSTSCKGCKCRTCSNMYLCMDCRRDTRNEIFHMCSKSMSRIADTEFIPGATNELLAKFIPSARAKNEPLEILDPLTYSKRKYGTIDD